MEATIGCTNCSAEYTALYRKARCADCGGDLLHLSNGKLVTRGPDEDVDDEDGDDDPVTNYLTELEQGRVMVPVETDNPYLNRLFDNPMYAIIPQRAVALFDAISPDADEKLLTALRVKHGSYARGYLLLTTNWIDGRSISLTDIKGSTAMNRDCFSTARTCLAGGSLRLTATSSRCAMAGDRGLSSLQIWCSKRLCGRVTKRQETSAHRVLG